MRNVCKLFSWYCSKYYNVYSIVCCYWNSLKVILIKYLKSTAFETFYKICWKKEPVTKLISVRTHVLLVVAILIVQRTLYLSSLKWYTHAHMHIRAIECIVALSFDWRLLSGIKWHVYESNSTWYTGETLDQIPCDLTHTKFLDS